MIKHASGMISGHLTAIDIGGGVGRTAKTILTQFFSEVDLVERDPRFIQEAKKLVPSVRNFYCQDLRDFSFPDKYDCIWIQWILMYLEDSDVELLLSNANEAAKPSKRGRSGLVFVKENVDYNSLVDNKDYVITRTDKQLRKIFSRVGLAVVAHFYQRHTEADGTELQDVSCYTLRVI